MAEISGGKTYFVNDGKSNQIFLILNTSFEFTTSGSGLQDIDDVFAESNTYQPKVPSHDEEIVVRKCTK